MLESLNARHDRHFPWCANYLIDKKFREANYFVDAAQNEMIDSTVKKLKAYLKLYGASSSGKKQVVCHAYINIKP